MTNGGKLIVVVVVVTTTVVCVAGANESCPRVSCCEASCIGLIGRAVPLALSTGSDAAPTPNLDDDEDVDSESEFEPKDEGYNCRPSGKVSEAAAVGRIGGSITWSCYGACSKRPTRV